ncbi:OLC1v1001762C1 [Oldenlandia corymbosa var. corymbosa]|uniref:OLC1v1001762C1 n=1 Tax=Oldenlandia corymbosa var. corymbosa TaxID=529605 RepID=A0AAV1D622_OLDCO|nr:OLC1v1001762C1 [Oldenlandia corymbosa var. corymbosa]
MSRYDYPRLPRHEMLGILSEFQIGNVSDSDLLKPTFDFVTNLYSALLLHIGILSEDHDQLDFEALERLENPDHHVESVRVMNLFDKIRELLAVLECPLKFTLKDLIKPEPDRTEIFLSAVLNFCLHREGKMNLFRPVVDELTLLEEKKQELEETLSKLNEEIEEHNQLRESEIPFVQELDAKVKELRQTIQSLNNHQMSLKVNMRKTKEKVKEMDEKIQNAEFALIQSVQENGSLHSKIVQSPDKLQRALDEKKSVKAEAKNAERAAMQAFHDKSALLELYTKASMKLSKQLAQMKAKQDQVNSAKTIEKDLKLLKANMSDQDVLNKSLEAKLIELQTKADQLDELKKQLEYERVQNREQVNKELENVKLEVETRRSGLQARQKQVEAMVMEADTINTKIQAVKESGAAKMQEMHHLCESITEKVNFCSFMPTQMLLMLPGMRMVLGNLQAEKWDDEWWWWWEGGGGGGGGDGDGDNERGRGGNILILFSQRLEPGQIAETKKHKKKRRRLVRSISRFWFGGRKSTSRSLIDMDSPREQDAPVGLKRKRDAPCKLVENNKQNDVAVTLAKPIILANIEDEANLVFSPLSLQIALGLIAAGSKGSTRDQLLSFLKFDSIDELNALSSLFVTTVLADGSPSGGPILSCANAFWIDQSLSFKSQFKDVIHDVYKAHSSQVDFQNKSDEVVAEVNAWAEKETNGGWQHPFFPPMTRDHKFYLLNGSTVKAPFMSSMKLQYISAYDGFQVLRLPYKQGNDRHRSFSMYLYLPDAKDGLRALVEKFSSQPGFFKNHVPRTMKVVCSFLVPKFKISFEFEASKILKSLGLVSPFTIHDGGLTNMVDSPIGDDLVSQGMFQKSFIEVNETGTEAAAVCSATVGGGMPVRTFNFVADHPFLYLIREAVTGVVLFMGTVLNPTLS